MWAIVCAHLHFHRSQSGCIAYSWYPIEIGRKTERTNERKERKMCVRAHENNHIADCVHNSSDWNAHRERAICVSIRDPRVEQETHRRKTTTITMYFKRNECVFPCRGFCTQFNSVRASHHFIFIYKWTKWYSLRTKHSDTCSHVCGELCSCTVKWYCVVEMLARQSVAFGGLLSRPTNLLRNLRDFIIKWAGQWCKQKRIFLFLVCTYIYWIFFCASLQYR